MGMTIECTNCHARFAGKEEYAGRRIRCPKCQNVFRVAGEKVEAAEPVAAARAAPVAVAVAVAPPSPPPPAKPKNKYAGMEIDEWNVPDDFEYSVTDEVDENATRCVFCHAEMKAEDVLCLKCGYNRELGQKMATKTGEEVFAEEERAKSQTSISFGGLSVPKKALWISAGVAAFVALALLLFAPLVLVILLLLAGVLLVLAGQIGVIYVSFQESTLQGVLVWFMPLYWWVYVFTRWDQAALPFLVWGVGMGMIVVAGAIGWSITGDEAAAAMAICCGWRA